LSAILPGLPNAARAATGTWHITQEGRLGTKVLPAGQGRHKLGGPLTCNILQEKQRDLALATQLDEMGTLKRSL